ISAAVVGHGGHVLDAGDLDAGVLERADGGLSARAGALHHHVHLADAVLHGPSRALLGRHLGGVGGGLARALEAHVAGRGPGEDVALLVGDGHDRVVERALDVRHAVRDVLALATAGAPAPGLGLGHYFITFFL